LSRAHGAERSEGTMRQAAPQGTSVDGGWLARKKIPPAGQISKLLALVGFAALVLAAASRKADRPPKSRLIRRSPTKLVQRKTPKPRYGRRRRI
jgi:hypothetical protein